jgi:hypothetical protein
LSVWRWTCRRTRASTAVSGAFIFEPLALDVQANARLDSCIRRVHLGAHETIVVAQRLNTGMQLALLCGKEASTILGRDVAPRRVSIERRGADNAQAAQWNLSSLHQKGNTS